MKRSESIKRQIENIENYLRCYENRFYGDYKEYEIEKSANGKERAEKELNELKSRKSLIGT